MSDLISRELAIDAIGEIHPLDYNAQAIKTRIEKLPSEEPEIIRCKDCEHYHRKIDCIGGEYSGCGVWLNDGNEIEVEENDFCSYAERKKDGQTT